MAARCAWVLLMYVGFRATHFFIFFLVFMHMRLQIHFCCFIVISNTSFLFPTFPLGRDASYLGELVELVTSPPLAPLSGPMNPSL